MRPPGVISLGRCARRYPASVTSERWPAYVYGEGEDPDYRFSLANERTFLAWLRTTLALLAAGVAVDVIDLGVPSVITRGLAAMLLTLGVLCPLLAFARWAMADALRPEVHRVGQHFGGHHAGLEDALIGVDVGDEVVERPRPLPQSFCRVRPFA